MLSIYAADINFVFACFPLLALVLSLPYVIYQYRRWGSIPPWKTLCVFSFALYLLCAFYLVILPLPSDRHALVPYAQTPQTDPWLVLRQLREAAAAAGLSSGSAHAWISFLRNQAVYQALFNVALTVPLGMFAQYFLRRPLWQTLLLGLVLSLFFELIQLSGLYGLYDHPYRLFDVDDLILNTLGAVVGWLIMVPLGLMLPQVDQMNARAWEKGATSTTFTRRALSFALDALLAAGLYAVLFTVVGQGSLAQSGSFREAFDLPLALLATGVVFMAAPLVLGMRTPGQLALGLGLFTPLGRKAPWHGPVVRYGLLIWVFLLIIPWTVYLFPGFPDGLTRSHVLSAAGTAYVLWAASIALRAFLSLLGKPFLTLFDLASNTRVMSVRQAQGLRSQLARPASGAHSAASPTAPFATPSATRRSNSSIPSPSSKRTRHGRLR